MLLHSNKSRLEHFSLLFRRLKTGGIHQEFAIIYKWIAWYGCVNLLSFRASLESMMRIVSGIARTL